YGRRPEVESFRRRDRSSGARSGCPPIAATQTGIGPRRSDTTRLCAKALIYAGCITVLRFFPGGADPWSAAAPWPASRRRPNYRALFAKAEEGVGRGPGVRPTM